MTNRKSIVLSIKSAAINYDIDPIGVCGVIDNELKSAGWTKCGGEMARVDRWEKNNERPIYVSYDPEHGCIGIS
jgi:hypothetical protein